MGAAYSVQNWQAGEKALKKALTAIVTAFAAIIAIRALIGLELTVMVAMYWIANTALCFVNAKQAFKERMRQDG